MPDFENNEPVTSVSFYGRYYGGHVRKQGEWRGKELWFRDRHVASIIQDDKYPQMWRVKLPDGSISDMVNLTRAKDAAISLARKYLE